MKKSRKKIKKLVLIITIFIFAFCTKAVGALTPYEQNQFNSLACMRRSNKEWISAAFLNIKYTSGVANISLNAKSLGVIENPPEAFRLIRIIEADMKEEPPAYYAMLLRNKQLSEYGFKNVRDLNTPQTISNFNGNYSAATDLLTKDHSISVNVNANKHYYFVFESTSNYKFPDDVDCTFNGVALTEAPLYIYTEADFYATGQRVKSSIKNYIKTDNAIETEKFSCDKGIQYPDNSFEAKYCADEKKAKNNNAKKYDFSIKSNSAISYEEYLKAVKKGASNTFKCDPFENLPSKLEKDKNNNIIYYQSQNTKYLIGESKNEVIVGKYVFNYGGQFKEGDCYTESKNGYVISQNCSGGKKVKKDSPIIGTSTNPDNIVTQDIACEVDCTEIVTVQYGAPVASKAGLCFEYKVKVTSRVNCGSKITTVAQPPENKYCDPSAECHYPPPPPPSGDDDDDDDCGEDCYGCDVNPHHDLCPNDGPNDEFDKCINNCDGGKYTLSCSQDCYNKVYGNSSSITKNSYIINDNFIATRIANIPRIDLKSPSQCINAHFSTTKNGNIVFLPDGCVAPIYEGLRDQMPCVKDHTNGGGIPCTCSCTLICSWSLPRSCNVKTDYLNEGEFERDQKKNQEAYDAANKSCSSFARCSTTQAEFSINVSYYHDKKNTKETIYYPYSENNSSTNVDTAKFNENGKVNCTNGNSNTVLLPINETQCYQCSNKNQATNELSRTYIMEWGFPGVWVNGKSRAISYAPKAGWYKLKNQFCIPINANNVNDLWWNIHHIDDVLNNKGTYSSNINSDNKNGRTIDYSSCRMPDKDNLKIDYNIKASTNKFGLFSWNINIECFYALNDSFPKYPSGNSCPGSKPEEEGYTVRSVSLDNLFPDSNGEDIGGNVTTTGRAPGFNWTSYAKNEKTTGLTSDPESYRTWVQQLAYDVYSEEYVDYDIYLSRNSIQELRNKKKNLTGFNSYNDLGTSDDVNSEFPYESGKSLLFYQSDLLRGKAPLLKENPFRSDNKNKIPETSLYCNNIKDQNSCFIAGEDR